MAGTDDLVSTQKGGVENLSRLAQAITNTMPIATASTSPIATGINTLSTTAMVIIASSVVRHGIVFHNPGSVNAYVFPTAIATSPTTALVGGSFIIDAGGTLAFAAMGFANVNAGWSGFSASGSGNPLTILEFL